MSERVARTTRRAPQDVCPGRHCWVADPVDGAAEKRAGLLVEWRRDGAGGWQGRVLYLAALRAGGWAVVEEWVDQALLSPS